MKVDRSFFLVLSCFVLSGGAGLIYETSWSQQFALVFGTSELAVATVLAAYMAGLMAGAATAARLIPKVRRPLLVYALLEGGIALSALAVPLALRLAGHLQLTLLGGMDLPPEAGSLTSAVFYLVAAFCILLVPTSLMGATLPLLARHCVRVDRDIGPRVGFLYTANTLGAAIGALFAAFFLLPSLGLHRTVLVAAGLNISVFAIAMVLARSSIELPSVEFGGREGSKGSVWILPLILLSGFVSLTFEVVWTRLFSNLLGGSIYAFGTMLATFLIGIAMGSAVASRFAGDSKSGWIGFSMAQIGIAVSSYLAFAGVNWVPGLLSILPFGGHFLPPGAPVSAVLLLPGAFCIGTTFPFAVRALADGAAEAGRASAQVFAWNTFGAIFGAVISGFVFLPVLRIAGTMTVGIVLNLTLALAAVLLSRCWALAPGLAAIASLVVVAVFPPSTPWNVLRTSPLSGKTTTGRVIYYGVGRSSTVLLMEKHGDWRLTTNGLPEASIQPRGGRQSRFAISHWLGLLPFVVRPETNTILVVGLGAGMTLEAVPEKADEIHVVEIEPEVVAANRSVSDQRRMDMLADPRVRIHLNDARSGLLLSQRRYDAVVSQPSHPWTAGASHLYTREFFELVRERLTAGGVFVQWIGLRFIDVDLLRSLLATLIDVFPHLEVYEPYPHGAFLFVASSQPLNSEESAERAFLVAEEQWRNIGVLIPEDILAARVLDTAGARRLAEGAPQIRDSLNLLAIGSPKIMHQPANGTALAKLISPDLDPLRRLAANGEGLNYVRRLMFEKAPARAARIAEVIPDPTERAVGKAIVEALSGQSQKAKVTLRKVLADDPESSIALHAMIFLEKGALLRGIAPDVLSAALDRDPDAAAVLEGWRLSKIERIDEIQILEPILAQIGPRHLLWQAATHLRIAWRRQSGDPDDAIEALELLEPLLAHRKMPGQALMLRARLGLQAGEPDIALASLAEVLESGNMEGRDEFVAGVRDLLRALEPIKGNDPMWNRLQRRLKDL